MIQVSMIFGGGVIFLYCLCIGSSNATNTEVHGANLALSESVQSMAEADRSLREKFAQTPDDEALVRMMVELDRRHEAKLIEILREHGCPSKADIGSAGLRALWVLIQHSRQEILKASIPCMQKAADDGFLSLSLVAMSIDRVLVNEGKNQRYGTQFKLNGRHFEMYPVEDEKRLDELRKLMGLGNMEKYRAELRKFYAGVVID